MQLNICFNVILPAASVIQVVTVEVNFVTKIVVVPCYIGVATEALCVVAATYVTAILLPLQ
jgi:hypothetical protein